MSATPCFADLRRDLLRCAAANTFSGPRLNSPHRVPGHFFRTIFPELKFALLAADEAASGGNGPWLDLALAGLDAGAAEFKPDGHIGAINDVNSVSFGLVPFTEALLRLRGLVPPARLAPLVTAAVTLFDDAAAHLPQTVDYLNPRGMDAVAAWNLFALTGDSRFRDKSAFWLDALLTRQYACGAQPYHTGGWIWGRKPAQAYQFLTATMMLALAKRMDRPDAADYVRRLLDFEHLACTRKGDCFVTLFEGLHKARSGLHGWLWPLALAAGDPRFQPLARTAFGHWLERVEAQRAWPFEFMESFTHALLMGVDRFPDEQGPPFRPVPGLHACADISAIFVHEPDLDLGCSLLTGYSSLAEADAGSIKLYALLPELTDRPTYRHGGLDAVRLDWKTPSEQDECRIDGNRALLRGRGFTKWINPEGNGDAARFLHTRELAISLAYENGTLVLEYRTLRNTQPAPLPSRLLFLLIALPRDQRPALRLDGETLAPPAADDSETWFRRAGVGPVVFSAPDGSSLEIVPERTRALSITAERPERDPKADKRELLKPANEGSLRLAFEGPDVLEEGRYVIRFRPAKP